jgi:4-amino-4-deoxy-L-arabinose transferase-like glycosyltransferase
VRTKRQQTAPSLSARSLAFLERRSLAISVALVAIASIRIIATYTVFNRTSDEPAHVACGMEWLDKGVYRWEPQHPPLARVAAALGPYLLGIRSQGTVKTSLFSMTYEGIAILNRDHHEDLTLALARLGILPFFWIACLAVYGWGKRYFSAAVGALGVFLFSFLPPVLAHSGLATTDMALTAFLGAAFLSAVVWTEQPTRAHALWFGACTGLAVLSKFSCLVFLPASAAVALAWYLFSERPKMAWLARAVRGRLPSFGLAVLVACLLIWAGYRFSFGGGLPAPELYSGIQTVMQHNTEGHPGYLLGQRSITGWWYFFEVALAVKTPLAFLILLGFGVAPVLRRHPRYRRPWLPLAFSGGILLVGVFSRINIGLRHVLPVYIGFALLAAVSVVRLLELAETRKWVRIALPVLVVWLTGSSWWSHPDYLAYFNELGGSQPEKILVDSDLDWGQDVKRLAQRLHEAGAREVAFVPLTLGDIEHDMGLPPIQGMDVQVPSHGWNAVGVTCWKEVRLGLGNKHPEAILWPDRVEPTERVGKSILLYYFP